MLHSTDTEPEGAFQFSVSGLCTDQTTREARAGGQKAVAAATYGSYRVVRVPKAKQLTVGRACSKRGGEPPARGATYESSLPPS